MIHKPRLSNQIYELLRSELRSGKYAADTRFTEPAIAKELATSRTPVREALFQLVNNGLLCEFDRGYGLPQLSSSDIRQMMDIRIALESLVVKKLCSTLSVEELEHLSFSIERERKTINKKDSSLFINANNEMRCLFFDYADDPFLKETGELYSDRMQVFRILTLTTKENRETVTRAHEELLAAIAKKNEKQALSIHKKMLVKARSAYIKFT